MVASGSPKTGSPAGSPGKKKLGLFGSPSKEVTTPTIVPSIDTVVSPAKQKKAKVVPLTTGLPTATLPTASLSPKLVTKKAKKKTTEAEDAVAEVDVAPLVPAGVPSVKKTKKKTAVDTAVAHADGDSLAAKSKKAVGKKRKATESTESLAQKLSGGDDSENDDELDKKYQKMDPRGHVEARPSRYVGSVQSRSQLAWVAEPVPFTMWTDAEGAAKADAMDVALLTAEALSPGKSPSKAKKLKASAVTISNKRPRLNVVLRRQDVVFSKGFMTIVGEPLCNSADNSSRPNRGMTYIKLSVDTVANTISVENDGKSIEIKYSKEYGMYYAQLLLGNMHTSSNYDDTEQRKTGGRHGEGSKLTSILSHRSWVEINDPDTNKHYSQEFTDHMRVATEPVISASKAKRHYIKFGFEPDLAKFGMTHLSDDVVGMLRARACEIAATTARKKVKVYFNDEWINIDAFTDYATACVQGMGGLDDDEVDDAVPNDDAVATTVPPLNGVQSEVVHADTTKPRSSPSKKQIAREAKAAKAAAKAGTAVGPANQLVHCELNEDWEFVVAVKPRDSTIAKKRKRGEDAESIESIESEREIKEPWSNAFVNHVSSHVRLIASSE